MRKGLSFILIILGSPTFSQRSNVVSFINRLEFDSAFMEVSALSDSKEKAYFKGLIQILKHGGQHKRDSTIISGLHPETTDSKDQLLLGSYYTLNGERGKALVYLLKSMEQFIANDHELLSINYLIVLHLYSRIILTDSYKTLIEEFQKEIKGDPHLQAWKFLHEIDYRNKIFDPSQDSIDYISLFRHTEAHFNRYSFNRSFKAHFSYRAGIFYRYVGQYDSARYFYAQCVDYADGEDYLRYIKFFSLIDLAGLQIQSGDIKEAEQNIQIAKDNWDLSDTTLTRLNYNLLMANQYHLRFQNWESAYHLMNEIWGERLQFFFENNNVRVSELQEEFNVQLKDSQIENQDNLIKSQNRFLYALFGFMLAMLLLILVLIFSFKSIRKKNQKIETLMRELHHRVKNNLQVISSMLGLQSMKLEDTSAKNAVNEGKGRIRAMALIHQKLYQNEEVTILNIREYLTNLINEIAQAYGHFKSDRIKISIVERSFDADVALSMGLIVNELVSNVFKYAFEEVDNPLLRINLQNVDKAYTLTVEDNGPGLPKGFDLNAAESFGMRLVNLLVKQLKGTLQVDTKNGLCCEIHFTNT
ncbi:MAG: sensor histidine kinase [Fulvivirga sp.]